MTYREGFGETPTLVRTKRSRWQRVLCFFGRHPVDAVTRKVFPAWFIWGKPLNRCWSCGREWRDKNPPKVGES